MKEEKNGQGEFLGAWRSRLLSHGAKSCEDATVREWYRALVGTLLDMAEQRHRRFAEETEREGGKRVAYLCMEFLVGRSLPTYLRAFGVRKTVEGELQKHGITLSEVLAEECDPGLGNGGLGRLAACFMESLSALSYPAIGYSLLYEGGFFRQRIVDGAQVELPDSWLDAGGIWLIPRPEKSVSVRFGGTVTEQWEKDGLHILHTDYDEVSAVPYDLLVPGVGSEAVIPLRLWRAKDVTPPPAPAVTQAGYVSELRRRSAAEELTHRLYPPDEQDEGKLLRLCQQYFLVSASLQNIIAEHFARGGSLSTLADGVAIHINDTHPALAIPELLRILMDVHSYSFEDALKTARSAFSYTNHTVMPEALECWRSDLFRLKLPRIYAIVEELNRRFTHELFLRYPGDWERISRMSILAYGGVRMANLCLVCSHTVNGVSRLHGNILKKTVFSDFYALYPERFTSVTNGVSHRRWLLEANRPLCALLDEVIGYGYRESPEELAGLLPHLGDAALAERLFAVRRAAKQRFSDFLVARGRAPLDPDAIFDVQIKRMHEYKRQLLNVLKILSLWQGLRDGSVTLGRPIVFLFGAKAAPSYYMAKELVRLIVSLGEALAADPLAGKWLRVEFCEEYNVSMAELLIPAADISEQISLSGKEASGTGCMKLMMNGALTLGTRDGANAEIAEAVGEEHIYIFGLSDREVEVLWQRGYDAHAYYRASPRLRAAIDRLFFPLAGRDFSHIANAEIAKRDGVADPYMCLADFDAYRTVYDRVLADYGTPRFLESALVNIAMSYRFTSDRSVGEYAKDIWHLKKIRGCGTC